MRPEASEQIKIFKEHVTNIQFSTDEYAYLISMKWLQKWYKSVGYYNNSEPTNDCPPIENKDLLSEDGENRRVLMEGIHHFVVKKNMWDLFVEWYGGGPEIKVEVGFDPIRKQNVPDVHPLTIHIFYVTSLIKKYSANITHDNQNTKNTHDVSHITINFSKYKTIDLLRTTICEKLGILSSRFSLFMLTSINEKIDTNSAFKTHSNDSLKKTNRKKLDGNRTLSEYHISNNQQLILDIDNDVTRNISIYKTMPEEHNQQIQSEMEKQKKSKADIPTGIPKANPITVFNTANSNSPKKKHSQPSSENKINNKNITADDQNQNIKMAESSKSSVPSSASMMFVKEGNVTFNFPTSTSMSFVPPSLPKGESNEEADQGVSTFNMNDQDDSSSSDDSEIVHHYNGTRSRVTNFANEDNQDTSNFKTFAGGNIPKNHGYLTRGPTKQIGICGLVNLGNTCFFNSSLQSLLHTMPLVDHFLDDHWRSELTLTNKLGTKGACANAYASIVERVWAGLATIIAPRQLLAVIQRYAPHFSGYSQQDAHELLLFLLDMIHEDLNRVKAREEIKEREELRKLQLKLQNENQAKMTPKSSEKKTHKTHKKHKKINDSDKNHSNSDSDLNEDNKDKDNSLQSSSGTDDKKSKKKKSKHNKKKNINDSDENESKSSQTDKTGKDEQDEKTQNDSNQSNEKDSAINTPKKENKKRKNQIKSSSSESSSENDIKEEKKSKTKNHTQKSSKPKEQMSTSSDDNDNEQNSNKDDKSSSDNKELTQTPTKKKENKKKHKNNDSDKESNPNKPDKNSDSNDEKNKTATPSKKKEKKKKEGEKESNSNKIDKNSDSNDDNNEESKTATPSKKKEKKKKESEKESNPSKKDKSSDSNDDNNEKDKTATPSKKKEKKKKESEKESNSSKTDKSSDSNDDNNESSKTATPSKKKEKKKKESEKESNSSKKDKSSDTNDDSNEKEQLATPSKKKEHKKKGHKNNADESKSHKSDSDHEKSSSNDETPRTPNRKKDKKKKENQEEAMKNNDSKDNPQTEQESNTNQSDKNEKEKKSNNTEDLEEYNGNDDEYSKKSWNLYKSRNDSIVVDTFHGLLRSKIRCPHCKTAAVMFDPFVSISLPITSPSHLYQICFVPYDAKLSQVSLTLPIPLNANKEVFERSLFTEIGRTCRVIYAQVSEAIAINSNNTNNFNTHSGSSNKDKVITKSLSMSALSSSGDMLSENQSNPIVSYSLQCLSLDVTSSPSPPAKSTKTYVFEVPDDINYCAIARLAVHVKGTLMNTSLKQLNDLYILEIPSEAPTKDELCQACLKRFGYLWTSLNPNKNARNDNVKEFLACRQLQQILKGKEALPFKKEDDYFKVKSSSIGHKFPKFKQTPVVSSSIASVIINGKFMNEQSGFIYQNLFRPNSETPHFTHMHHQHANGKVVNVDYSKKKQTLDGLLKTFTSPTLLDEDNKWYCPKCKEFVCADKKLDIWSMPKCFIVHFKRFAARRNNRGYKKIETNIEFDDIVDFSPYVVGQQSQYHVPTPPTNENSSSSSGDYLSETSETNKNKNKMLLYKLYAVIHHNGQLNGGHYTVHSYVESQNKWFFFNDAVVKESTQQAVHQSSAYILFYQRIDEDDKKE